MPTSSDLVTDLPADFEVFGQAVDTSLADLKGGTTNQVLAKNSNTDMDFKWVTDATGMTNPMTTTGDTIYSSSGSTPARLGIGSTGQILTVSGGLPVWAAPAGGGKVLQVITATTSTSATSTSGSYADTNLTANITPSSASSRVLILIEQYTLAKRSQEEAYTGLRIMRDATAILTNDRALAYRTGTQNANMTEFSQNVPLIYVDSPATTSAITYKTQFNAGITANSGSAGVQSYSQTSTITLLEIGA